MKLLVILFVFFALAYAEETKAVSKRGALGYGYGFNQDNYGLGSGYGSKYSNYGNYGGLGLGYGYGSGYNRNKYGGLGSYYSPFVSSQYISNYGGYGYGDNLGWGYGSVPAYTSGLNSYSGYGGYYYR